MTNLLKLTTLVCVFIATGCTEAELKPHSSAHLTSQTLMMKSKVPFKKGVFIKQAIRSDCKIQTQLPEFTKKYAQKNNKSIILSNSATKYNSPYYLELLILDAVSEGNAFIGHRKFTRIQGILYRNGKKVSSFIGQRHSMGGFFAGYKGSCSVLARTVDTLGKDISAWLKHPNNNAYLGD